MMHTLQPPRVHIHASSRAKFKDLQEVSNSADCTACILDLRKRSEYDALHIRHAVNFPPEKYQKKDVNEIIEELKSMNIHIFIRHATLLYEKTSKKSLRS